MCLNRISLSNPWKSSNKSYPLTTLFIADLHLSGQRPEITEAFLRFLREEAASSEALYILGDLFEFWIGDDFRDPALEPVLAGLKQLTAQGIPVFLQHGNRDFFSRRCLLCRDRLPVTGRPYSY